MRKRDDTAASAARTRRIAWLVSVVVPLVVLALLLTLKPAHAATPAAGPAGAIAAPSAMAAVGEPAEGEGEEAEGCEAAGEEVEAETEAEEVGEETEVEAGEEEAEGCEAAGVPPPASCLLRSAHARILVYAPQDRVRLLVDYTSSARAQATVEYRLEGNRGSLRLGDANRTLADRGVLHLSRRLTSAQMAKVRAAKSFTVELQVPTAPRSCRRFDTRHLTTKRTTRYEIVWSQAR